MAHDRSRRWLECLKALVIRPSADWQGESAPVWKSHLDIRLGTDLVYIPRIRDAVQRFGDRFLQRIYTNSEQQDCGVAIARATHTQGNPSPDILLAESPTVIQRLAARWAAKEAVVKALGTGWRGIGYREVEIQRQPNGAPLVCLSGPIATSLAATWSTCQWQLSLSHDGHYAIASAILICLP